MRLSKGQRDWLIEIMYGGYDTEEYYRSLYDQIKAGDFISEVEPLTTLLESIIDRVNYGDKDKTAYRDRSFAQRIITKIHTIR